MNISGNPLAYPNTPRQIFFVFHGSNIYAAIIIIEKICCVKMFRNHRRLCNGKTMYIVRLAKYSGEK